MEKSLNPINRAWPTRGLCGLVVFVACMVFVEPVQGQKNLNATFRPAVNFPTQKLGEVELKKGGGFEATVSYRFIPSLGVYVGWGWNSFAQKGSADNSKVHFEETGYSLGLQFVQPLASESKLNFILSAGAILNHIETENEEGDIIADSGHGWGWQADAGLSIPLNSRWQMIPSIRYHALPATTPSGGVDESIDLNYLSLGVGVSWTLYQGE